MQQRQTNDPNVGDGRLTAAQEQYQMARFMGHLGNEYREARAKNGTYASHHEAYAVLLEEVDEYWQQVKRKPSKRDAGAMYQELVQIAQVAMAAAVLLVSSESETRP